MASELIDKLFSVGAHFGYSPSRRHPSTACFIFGNKGGVELIDLEKTAAALEKALAFLKEVAASRRQILFVGGKAEASGALKRAALRVNQPYVAGRFIGGTLTNFSEIKKRLNRLAELTETREKGELAKFTKREQLLLDRQVDDLTAMFGGLRGMEKLPAAVFAVDPKREHIAVEEAHALNIPVVALLNTDCDARGISYPIPGNDANTASISLILEEATKAIAQGLEVPLPAAQEGSGKSEASNPKL